MCPAEDLSETFEMLTSLNLKWAMMASFIGEVAKSGMSVPPSVIKGLRLVRVKIDSRCYSGCEVERDMNGVEAELFPLLVDLGEPVAERFSKLSEKAAAGEISVADINLSLVRRVFPNLESLPC